MKKSKKSLLALVAAVLAVSCDSSENNSDSKPGNKVISMQSESANLDSELMLNLVNDVRSKGCDCTDKNGKKTKMPPVPALIWNEQLTAAARLHSEDMAANNFFSHDNLKKQSFADRVTQIGYAWSAVAENIAKGARTEKQAFEGWMKSYGHCKNIMNPDVREIGAARSVSEIPYWTQVFASKKQ